MNPLAYAIVLCAVLGAPLALTAIAAPVAADQPATLNCEPMHYDSEGNLVVDPSCLPPTVG